MKAKFILLLLSTILSLGLLECGMYIFWKDQTVPYRNRKKDKFIENVSYFQYGKYIPLTLKEGYKGKFINGDIITINSHGFRDLSEETDCDILCVGDSFTFGYFVGDRETYPYFLEKHTGLNVINAGYKSGLSYDTAMLSYKKELHKYNPRLVICAVYPDNDFDDVLDNIWDKKNERGCPEKLIKYNHILLHDVYKYPILRESRLFVNIGIKLSNFFRRNEIVNLRKRDVNVLSEILIREFVSDINKYNSKLVFLFFNEPYESFAKYGARRNNCSISEYKKSVERKKDHLELILDKYKVLHFDNLEYFKQLKQRYTDRTLSSDDGVHYNGFTNDMLSRWIFSNLKEKSLL